MPACAKCGEDNPERARFCLACGSAMSPAAEHPRAARKTVTILFSDVTDSTVLGERLDPESLRSVMTRYYDTMRTVIERHGGTVEKFIGDAVMAVFGVPVLHEDDAVRAVRAAWEMRQELEALNQELGAQWEVRLRARTGVNTGEVVAGDPDAGEALVVGDAVNTAARLEQNAEPGEILIGEPTFRMVRDAVVTEAISPKTVKGKAEPVPAHRLLDVLPGAAGVSRHLDSPIVGRGHERAMLQQAFDRVVTDRSCHLFTVLGSAGVGKSRLAAELAAWCALRARILTGRCLPYGEGITFWPVAEILREAAPLQEDEAPGEIRRRLATLLDGEPDADVVAERLGQLLGVSEGYAETEETRWAVRRLLESLGRSEPLVVVFDDLHWAEPVLLDLIEYIADWARDAPILLVCLARPELLDARPAWAGGKLNATSILLEPLSDGEAETLIRNLLGSPHVARSLSERIATAAEGNPLFVEEMVSMLIDDGILQQQDGMWSGDIQDVQVPPTIHALVAARLERLSAGERAVLECASVEGKEFHAGSVASLAPEIAAAEVSDRLRSLVRKELIRPERSDFAGEDAFAFRHILIRDAAYQATPKEVRSRMHTRFAEWLEASAGARLPEYEEIVGYHLEQAHDLLRELGRPPAEYRELGQRAAERLARAGYRARDRGDPAGGLNLLERAALLLPPLDPVRLGHEIAIGEAMWDLGEFARAEEVIARIVEAAAELGDEGLEWRGRMLLHTHRVNMGAEESTTDAYTDAENALPVFERLGDEDGLYRAWYLIGLCRWMQARSEATATALLRAAEHAARSGNRRNEVSALSMRTMTAAWGTDPPEAGLRLCDEVLARAGGHPLVEAEVSITKGSLEARRGNIELGLKLAARGIEILEQLGSRLWAAANSQSIAQIHLLAGDPAAAERHLRSGYEALERMGERAYLSTVAALLGEALFRLERLDEAETFVQRSVETSDPSDLASQIQWRLTRSRIRAARGDREEAESLARQASDLSADTDFLDLKAEAALTLAGVLRDGEHTQEAVDLAQRARRLSEQKGNVVGLREAENVLAMLGTSPPAADIP